MLAAKHWQQFLNLNWDPSSQDFGILSFALNSLFLAFLATLLSTLWVLVLSVFLFGVEDNMFHRPLRMSLRIMLAVPTIVYALMGALYLVPAVRGFTGASGYSFLAVTLTLSVMLVPFLMKQCEGLFQAALLHQNSAASNSGFSVLQTFLWVIFPQCRTGFLALVFLGFCRSLGDTMIALIVSGNTPVLVEGWLSPFRNLTAHIALMAPTDAYSLMYASSFVSLGLLLAFSVTISSVAYVLIFKNKRWLW